MPLSKHPNIEILKYLQHLSNQNKIKELCGEINHLLDNNDKIRVNIEYINTKGGKYRLTCIKFKFIEDNTIKLCFLDRDICRDMSLSLNKHTTIKVQQIYIKYNLY